MRDPTRPSLTQYRWRRGSTIPRRWIYFFKVHFAVCLIAFPLCPAFPYADVDTYATVHRYCFQGDSGGPLVCRREDQTRHNVVGGNPYFYSENLYQSVSFIYASMYRENVRAIHIGMQFANKIATLCNKNRQPRTKIGALLHVAEKYSRVDDKSVLFRYT